MFPDPLTYTLNGVAKTLARVEVGTGRAVYRTADGLITLTISHRQGSAKDRIQTMVRFDQKKVVTDPLTAAQDYDIQSDWHVFERPAFGFSMTDMEQQVAASNAFLTTAYIDKLFGGES